jgi:hypothetical protein
MRPAWLAAVLLVACVAAGTGCNRKRRSSQPPATAFPPEAVQEVVNAEKSPQASLALLNEALQNWLLRRNSFPADPQEFVAAGMLPRLPAAPPGKRFVVDTQLKRVVLTDQ